MQLEPAKQCPPGGIAILSLGQYLGSGRHRYLGLFSREKAVLEFQTQNTVASPCCTHARYNHLSLFYKLKF